jgi:hypothetical protein
MIMADSRNSALRGAKKRADTKKAGKAASNKPKAVNFRTIRAGTLLEYGDPIRDAVARGDVNELRKLAAVARKQIRGVEKVLQVLERNIAKAEK